MAEELVRHGYASFSLERVAVRAGVHRGTVYRHWPTRQALIAATAAEWHVNRLDAPDTGHWEGDLRALAASMASLYERASTKAILRTLVAASTADRALHDELLAIFAGGSDHLLEPVRRARARGELRPDVDEGFVIESLSAPLVQRCAVTDIPLDAVFLERTVRMVLAATVRQWR